MEVSNSSSGKSTQKVRGSNCNQGENNSTLMSKVLERVWFLLSIRGILSASTANCSLTFSLFPSQCSGLGASFCYMLSYLVGRPVVYKYLTERAQKWSQQVRLIRLIDPSSASELTSSLPSSFRYNFTVY